jgi:hypothetical protein
MKRMAETLVGYYKTIIDQWTKSAWAQKAAIEVVPLIIMSESSFGTSIENSLIRNQIQLLRNADDAVQIGENPEELRAEVFIQFIQLAHSQNDALRIKSLLKQVPPKAEIYQDQITLAAAYATVRLEDSQTAWNELQTWLDNNPKSEYRPLAILGLFNISTTNLQRSEVIQLMFTEYSKSLEMSSLRNIIDRQ